MKIRFNATVGKYERGEVYEVDQVFGSSQICAGVAEVVEFDDRAKHPRKLCPSASPDMVFNHERKLEERKDGRATKKVSRKKSTPKKGNQNGNS